MLKRLATMYLCILLVLLAVNFLSVGLGYAQDQTAPEQPKWLQFATAAVNALMPSLWTLGGPAVMLGITTLLNRYKVFVPREFQVVLGAAFTGLGAFFGGGMDLTHTVGAAVNSGVATTVAATEPEKLKLSDDKS